MAINRGTLSRLALPAKLGICGGALLLQAEREVEHVAGLVAELEIRTGGRRKAETRQECQQECQNEARSHDAPQANRRRLSMNRIDGGGKLFRLSG